MTFATDLAELPFTATTPNGSGFFPPIFRASGHILFLLACLADENVTVSDDEAVRELNDALAHWANRTSTDHISTAATAQASTINNLINSAAREYRDWDTEDRVRNIRDLANRIAQFSATLDRELVGLRNSDPGSTL